MFLAVELLWESQISTQTIALLDLQSLGPPLQGTLLKPQEVFSRELFPTY